MKSRHVAAAGLGALALASVLAGCTSASKATQSHPVVTTSPSATSVAAAAATPTPTPSSVWAPTQLPPSAVVATGTLASADGRTTGQVALIVTAGTVTATLANFHTTATGQLDLQLSPHDLDATCPADSYSFVMNGIDGDPDAWSLPVEVPGGPFNVDPTYLRSIVLRADAEGGKPNADGCIYPELAVAPLKWNVPASPSFTVTDRGSRPHATGNVGLAAGLPSTYTVAPDDDLEAIDARFGITSDQFDFLNPFDSGMVDADLRYGSVFNLSVKNRGIPPH